MNENFLMRKNPSSKVCLSLIDHNTCSHGPTRDHFTACQQPIAVRGRAIDLPDQRAIHAGNAVRKTIVCPEVNFAVVNRGSQSNGTTYSERPMLFSCLEIDAMQVVVDGRTEEELIANDNHLQCVVVLVTIPNQVIFKNATFCAPPRHLGVGGGGINPAWPLCG